MLRLLWACFFFNRLCIVLWLPISVGVGMGLQIQCLSFMHKEEDTGSLAWAVRAKSPGMKTFITGKRLSTGLEMT